MRCTGATAGRTASWRAGFSTDHGGCDAQNPDRRGRAGGAAVGADAAAARVRSHGDVGPDARGEPSWPGQVDPVHVLSGPEHRAFASVEPVGERDPEAAFAAGHPVGAAGHHGVQLRRRVGRLRAVGRPAGQDGRLARAVRSRGRHHHLPGRDHVRPGRAGLAGPLRPHHRRGRQGGTGRTVRPGPGPFAVRPPAAQPRRRVRARGDPGPGVPGLRGQHQPRTGDRRAATSFPATR